MQRTQVFSIPHFLFMLMVSVITLVLLNGCSSRNLHPHFENDNDVLRRQWSYPIEPLSSELTNGGMEYVAPVLHENTLIFGSSRYGLVSLYPNIERERWKMHISNGVVSPIEIEGNRAFFTGGDGNVYAISLDSGKPIWTYSLRNPVSSKPAVDGNDLYIVTSDDALLSLEANSGKWQWHYRRRNVSGPTIHGASRPLVIGDTVWVGFADGALVALTRKEGKVLWEKQLNTNKRFSSVNAEFVLKDNVVYVPAYDGAFYALNAKTGNPIWVKEGMGGGRKVTVTDAQVFVPSSNGTLYALDQKTGSELWRFDLDQGNPSDVVVTPKHVIVASTGEYIYALERTTGKMVWRWSVGYNSGFSGGLAYDPTRNWIYALSRGGNLMAFSYHEKGR